MSSVLACITESPSVRRVVGAASRCARALGLPARFVHVGAEPTEATARLGAVTMGLAGVGVEARRAGGRVDAAILEAIREASPAMIVMGAVRRENSLRDLIGSTARRVANRAPCSALLVSTQGRAAEEWSRFVALVDESPGAAGMAADAVRIALSGGQEIAPGVDFVMEYRDLSMGGGGSTERVMAAGVAQRLALFVEGLDTAGVQVRCAALPGRAGQEAARYAEDARADLLCLSAPMRPMGALSRVFSHPLSLVLDHLPCSLLLHRGVSPEVRRS